MTASDSQGGVVPTSKSTFCVGVVTAAVVQSLLLSYSLTLLGFVIGGRHGPSPIQPCSDDQLTVSPDPLTSPRDDSVAGRPFMDHRRYPVGCDDCPEHWRSQCPDTTYVVHDSPSWIGDDDTCKLPKVSSPSKTGAIKRVYSWTG